MDLALLLLRVVVGAILIGHGTQKLFGWFGGYGLEGTGGWLASVGFRPGKPMALIAGASEAVGGALLLLGFLSPLASATVIGVMIVAGATHFANGFWAQGGGYEYPAVLAVVAAALGFAGPGAYSLDNALGLNLAGTGWGLAAVALAVVSAGATIVRRNRALAKDAQAAQDAADEQLLAA